MDETTTQDLKKQFDTLPIKVQNAILDVNLPTKLQEISKNNKLMIDQAGKLKTETILVLFGLEPLKNYVGNLKKNVGLSDIQASVVARDVNESIFKDVRDTLIKRNEYSLEIDKRNTEKINNPSKEDILAGIENPKNIRDNGESFSVSSRQINTTTPKTYETVSEDETVEIRPEILPEVAPIINTPSVSMKNEASSRGITSFSQKPVEPFHVNISPAEDIVKTKLTSTITVPNTTIKVEEKTKLPQKSKSESDPYREPIN